MMVLIDISAAPAAAGNRIPKGPSTYRAYRNLLPYETFWIMFRWVAFAQGKDLRTILQITSTRARSGRRALIVIPQYGAGSWINAKKGLRFRWQAKCIFFVSKCTEDKGSSSAC
jgi:hypothetical protein